ncbi:hypothetical protein ACYULU_00220 [Breznakiellaceae bacterium SP9]
MGNHYKSLFSDKQALLDLYNSIKGTQYDEQTELIINTLPETLFTHQRNDVSFLIDGRLVLLAEHQSTTKGTKGRSFSSSNLQFAPSCSWCTLWLNSSLSLSREKSSGRRERSVRLKRQQKIRGAQLE